MTGDDHHRDAVVRRLYSVLTVRLEDAAQLAVGGQSSEGPTSTELAHQLIDIGQETVAIAEAIILITQPAAD